MTISAAPDADKPVLVERRGARLDIVFNRPAQRNSIDPAMMQGLYDAVKQASGDASLSVVVIRGMGKDFCPGADLKYYSQPAVQASNDSTPLYQYRVSTMIAEMPAVTIAAIRGGCAGAGFGWACAADVRIADTSAKFNSAFLDVGVAGDMGGPWTLSRLIGAGRARDLYFFPRKILAQEALSLGLISRLATPEAFEDELEALVARLLAANQDALQTMKRNFVSAATIDLASYVDLEAAKHELLFSGGAARKAFAGFAKSDTIG